MPDIKRILTSSFGLGFMPIAPGTWGSLGPVGLYILFYYYPGIEPDPMRWVMLAVAIVASIICIAFSGSAIKACGRKDPGEVVVDETAGQAITLMFAYAVNEREMFAMAVGAFVLFRIFDIIKPWPCKVLEKLPKGVGILADDLMAGVYAGALLFVFRMIYEHGSGVLNAANAQ